VHRLGDTALKLLQNITLLVGLPAGLCMLVHLSKLLISLWVYETHFFGGS